MKITCPDCDAVFRVADDWPSVKKIRCPECDGAFSLSSAVKADRPRRAATLDDEDDYEDDRGPRRRSRQKQGSGALVVIPIVIGGLLLIGLVAAGLFVVSRYLRDDDKDTIGAKARIVSPKGAMPRGRQGQGGERMSSRPPLNKEAPDIEGVDADGHKFRLSDYRGKVVVLDFWAGW